MPHVSKHNNLTKKGKKTATATAPEPEPPAHLAFQEAHYNDEDVVRDFSDLLSRTCRVWNDGSFHSDMMNGGTGAMFNNGHHIPDGGAKTRKSFANGTFAFCLEWVDVVFDGKTYRVRCQNQFLVKSDQCTQHSKIVHKDRPKRVLCMLGRSDTLTWGILKEDADATPLTGEQAKAKAQKECTDLQAEVDRLDMLGEDVTELREELAKKKKALHKWKTAPANEDAAQAERANPVVGTILSSRRGANNSAPGNPVLDAKAKRNPNDKKMTRKTNQQPI
ncbi:hypothetical protein PtrSN002B_007236 [Pyrenophora tritici-repentis]|uniref:Uncharacterized protein n=1 Tax=Pyrenophora tritici-repentis TaxID=45151 RepID=A0A2W1CPD9_9PLEO|nr:hypothetical protein PtrV1_13119 [Pyrenophora tritici-repentis]KAF7446916.1 hypothetical protein A1F99_083630 [Pyrenophora tritici-repentis]KAF7569198.1 hypothetical protein PtrM4_116130 [Pyrenophora tritici-repentis]KAG9383014.1 hypothetical protein A1F94_006935 [Pyrenophora tritici-repentis]KAI0574892.1 hypothetical protein Alg215_08338 [Pyrenophora tritici-repentis]